jgi:hypothetical protein
MFISSSAGVGFGLTLLAKRNDDDANMDCQSIFYGCQLTIPGPDLTACA